MSDRNSQYRDILDRNPGKVIRNTRRESQVDDPISHGFIRAAARLVARVVDPALGTAEAVALILGSGTRSGLLSIEKIVCEAGKDDPDRYTRGKFDDRWSVPNFCADLLGFLLRDEQWGHHVWEAAEELMELAVARKSGRITTSVAEVIHRVCELDLKLYRNSPGYLLHLLLTPAARPGGEVASAVHGMYRRVFLRWHAACRLAFGTFDLSLRPDVTMEKFARALAVVADGVALQTTSTSGQLDAPGQSDASLLAEISMMLLVGAVDVDKTGVSLVDAANVLIESAGNDTAT
jgi:hypothetical protein